MTNRISVLFASLIAITQFGCAVVPTSGPTASQMLAAGASPNAQNETLQIVDVDEMVARRLVAERPVVDFSTALGIDGTHMRALGPGDVVEVSIWEAPPATLFGISGTSNSEASGVGGAHVTVLPAQTIDTEGEIFIPFGGTVKASGLTTRALAGEISNRLKGKANQAQVIVKLTKNVVDYVTVLGDVKASARMELTPGGERVLDAIAAAGGLSQSTEKTTIQISRANVVVSVPMDSVLQNPRENVLLWPNDVVTALNQPLAVTILGASGKNDELNFESRGISLAQALARSGGLDDNRSDPKGVFLFRFASASSLDWKNPPVRTTLDGRVPVIFRFDLKNPETFFVAQDFRVENGDLIYIANAPLAELQKFINILFSGVYPIVTTATAVK